MDIIGPIQCIIIFSPHSLPIKWTSLFPFDKKRNSGFQDLWTSPTSWYQLLINLWSIISEPTGSKQFLTPHSSVGCLAGFSAGSTGGWAWSRTQFLLFVSSWAFNLNEAQLGFLSGERQHYSKSISPFQISVWVTFAMSHWSKQNLM